MPRKQARTPAPEVDKSAKKITPFFPEPDAAPRANSPSKYDPKNHPQLVLDLMAKGLSRNTVCARIGISKVTLQAWTKAHPEFKEALEVGNMLSQSWWERMGQVGLVARDFQTALYQCQVRNRFQWSSGDPKVVHDHSGKVDHEMKGTVKVSFDKEDECLVKPPADEETT